MILTKPKAKATKVKDNKFQLEENYENMSAITGAEVIGGAIFNSQIDLTHPLAYGYQNVNIPIFRRGTQFFAPYDKQTAPPLKYTDAALLSGYISQANLQTLNNSASILVGGVGQGRVIGFVDNTNFRAFWYGTNKLFANAVFFGHTIDRGGLQYAAGEEEVEEAEENH